MIDLILQDSYIDWIMPLTLAIMWFMGWELFSKTKSRQAAGRAEESAFADFMAVPIILQETPHDICSQIVKTVKRKECPDDPEGPHLSI